MTKKQPTKSASPVVRWAAIGIGGRREYIHPDTLSYTRRDAKAAWLAFFFDGPVEQEQALARVRFARVVVSME